MSNEIQVCLTLTSTTADPDELTSTIGIQPDKVWRTGDQIGASSRKYEHNGWQISSGRPADSDLEDHLQGLMELLAPATTALSSFAHNWEAELSCTIYAYESSPAISFGADTVKFFGDIGAAIDVDLYCLNE